MFKYEYQIYLFCVKVIKDERFSVNLVIYFQNRIDSFLLLFIKMVQFKVLI